MGVTKWDYVSLNDRIQGLKLGYSERMISVSKQKTYIYLVMEKIYKRRPIEELLKLEEIEDWEWPNEEMELFPYQFEDKRNIKCK